MHMQMYGMQDFKKLKQIAKKTQCKVKINNKKGMPFLMNKYRKRKIFLACLMVITIVLYGTSRFIWNIQIEGIDRVSEDEIRTTLKEMGLEIRKKKIYHKHYGNYKQSKIKNR